MQISKTTIKLHVLEVQVIQAIKPQQHGNFKP